MKVVIHNSSEFLAFASGLAQSNEWPISISYTFGAKRSLDANAVQHLWYKQISEHTGEDIKTVGNMCKLDFGLPILLAGIYGDKISYTLKKIEFHKWQRQQQINFMDILAVTSLFKSKEHNQYRDNMQAFYRDNGLELRYLNG